ncbi:MAG: hypothetical protein ACOX5C_06295 [Acutalibacteraceae bacterium]|jgi:hypothetical protein
MENIMQYIQMFFDILREFLALFGIELPDCLTTAGEDESEGE